MIANQQFFKQEVLIDGEEFFNCQFTESQIVFRGTGPVRFEDCVFTECEWVFGGPAKNTLVFLSALASNLGGEAAAMVRNLLDSIAAGEIDEVLERTRPPVAV